MPSNGRSPSVRSHRRGGPRRRGSVAPWLATALVLALIGGGVSAGYYYLIKGGCSGSVSATVIVTPRIEPIMQRLSRSWADGSPSIRGTCISVTISPGESATVSAELAGDWDAAMGAKPVVWVPECSAWVRKAPVGA